MRFALAIVVAACAACSPASAQAQAWGPAASGSAGSDPVLSGKLQERIDAGSYSYLRIATAAGEVWAAVPVTTLKAGAEVRIDQPVWMKDFESKTLGRKWPRIAFGTLSGPEAAPPGKMPADANHSFAHPKASPPADVGEAKVPRAPGKSGRTVAEVFAQRAALSGHEVAVRGKVVKFTEGVLGRNWIHLRDGTGSDGSNDLTVTTSESCAVGDVVLLSGTARVDQDFGAGYRYPVLVEGARLQSR